MKFIDEAKITVSAGKGGNGCIGWRREKFVPFGGPDGGNGGCGGSVIFVTDSGLNTLIDFSFNPQLRAENGKNGEKKQCDGRNGQDIVKKLPVGTQVYYNGQLIADLSSPGARWVAARGGHGGKGNTFFKSSTQQAPDFAQPGQEGEEFEFKLVLKSIADVGLVGFPNVGKSTFISRTSAARPKVAAYPFTTIRPNLGVVNLDSERKFVIADIPGLIPGAHKGKGLGITFLKHIERTHALAHFIDVSCTIEEDNHLTDDIDRDSDEYLREVVWNQFNAINEELSLFSQALLKKPRLIVFSKGDLQQTERAYKLTVSEFENRGFDVSMISSVTGAGISQILDNLYELTNR